MAKSKIYYRAAVKLMKMKYYIQHPGACNALFSVDYSTNTERKCELFTYYFHPRGNEWDKYKITDSAYWLYSENRTPEQNRQDRTIALLLMDQIYQDDNKPK